jgi:hypothetical protein
MRANDIPLPILAWKCWATMFRAGRSIGNEGKPFWILDGFKGEVNIKT